jgi:hypothetical protein
MTEQRDGLTTGDLVRLTGLSERSIRRLESRGVITATREHDEHGNPKGSRVFHPDVIPFLRHFYKRPELPAPSGLMVATASVVARGTAAGAPALPEDNSQS